MTEKPNANWEYEAFYWPLETCHFPAPRKLADPLRFDHEIASSATFQWTEADQTAEPKRSDRTGVCSYCFESWVKINVEKCGLIKI